MEVLQAAAESKEGLPKLLGNPAATAGHQRTSCLPGTGLP